MSLMMNHSKILKNDYWTKIALAFSSLQAQVEDQKDNLHFVIFPN